MTVAEPAAEAAADETVRVDLGTRGYDIVVGAGVLARAAEHLEPVLDSGRVAVVTDRTVAALHLATLSAALDGAGIGHDVVVLPTGETAKSFRELEKLVEALLATEIGRDGTIVALGGGVVGDMAGFAASVLRRGIGYVQAPTTLLAQVDSSVGGKTGINTRHGKNLVGAFHQPLLVLADTGTVDTLPERQFHSGYAEMAKYGLIADADFFSWLEAHGGALRGDEEARRLAVVKSCTIKAAIVAEDERETGRRALLNLGHTFGHALETEAGYSDDLLHGEAVAIGMVLAFELSARMGLCPAEDAERVRAHLRQVGLPTAPGDRQPAGVVWKPDALVERMRQDKKVRQGKVKFVLTRGIGDAFVAEDVDLAQVRALLDDTLV